MKTEKIAGHALHPGLQVNGYLDVAGTDIALPYALRIGDTEGPLAVIAGGVHNAEFVGIQAAIELMEELGKETLRGGVVILPLCNRSGFEHRTMSMVFEDGKNLNRVFPGDPAGSPAERLAYAVFHEFILKGDLYIDLHSGDGYELLSPYAYYLENTPAEAASMQMMECVNVPRCVRSRSRGGGAYNQAAIHGVPSVLIERGCLSLWPREEIEADKADVRNILRRFGILPGEYVAYPKEELRELDDDAPCTGCWYPAKAAGDRFAAGEVLGEIRDYFGQVICTHRAARDGVLLHQLAGLNVIQGDPLIAYGVPVETA